MKNKIGMHRGVNLGGWLSQCDYSADRLNHFIKEEDFGVIASWGLDHVRIPVDFNVLEDDKGGYDAPGWALILPFPPKFWWIPPWLWMRKSARI